MTDEHAQDHGPSFKAYMIVFCILCVCTALSFLFNEIVDHQMGRKHLSVALIIAVAIIKAAFVGSIFMHLKWDFTKVYGIMLPVCIVTLMMVIILSIDQTLAWHAYPESIVPIQPEPMSSPR